MYKNRRMKHVETSRNELRREIRKIMERVISTTVHCKNFGKCHNVSPCLCQYNNNMVR
jgi:hypothetical protein